MLNPIPCSTTSNPDRNFFCRHYEPCLDLAVSRRWEGFTCRSCGAYEPIEVDREWWIQDGRACLALVLTLFHRKVKQIHPGTILQALEDRDRAGQWDME